MSRKPKIYEITRKKPKFTWQKRTIKQAVYEALKDLKRAEVPKILHAVASAGFDVTSQEKRVRHALWEFERDGIARARTDRRWQPRRRDAECAKSRVG